MSSSGPASPDLVPAVRQDAPGEGPDADPDSQAPTRVLDPCDLVTRAPRLSRAARGMCHSHHEAEDLVQETFAQVLSRPRTLRRGNELRYLLRALRNTHRTARRAAARHPSTVSMLDVDLGGTDDPSVTLAPRDLIVAIAAAPEPYRDAVVTIDLLGLTYEQAARCLRTNKGTITSRLSRGREHLVRALDRGPVG